MSLGPWKKYRKRKIKGINGKSGYILSDKKVIKDSNGNGLICVPSTLVGKRVNIVVMEYDETFHKENKDFEEVKIFK